METWPYNASTKGVVTAINNRVSISEAATRIQKPTYSNDSLSMAAQAALNRRRASALKQMLLGTSEPMYFPLFR